MKTHVSGQHSVTSAVAPTLHLGTYRRAIMSAMSADEFTSTERLRANHAVYECQDCAKLALWLTNVTRLQAEREAKLLADFAQGIEQGEELVRRAATAPQPPTAPQPELATGGQRNNLKMAAWQLHISEPQRHRLLDRIIAPDLTRAAAAQLLAELECADPAPEPQQWAMPSQCDEVYRLACLPCFTAGEKQAILRHLPQLTQVGAITAIGKLYATVLRRTGRPVGTDGSQQLTA